jgi:hypothetical protein
LKLSEEAMGPFSGLNRAHFSIPADVHHDPIQSQINITAANIEGKVLPRTLE